MSGCVYSHSLHRFQFPGFFKPEKKMTDRKQIAAVLGWKDVRMISDCTMGHAPNTASVFNYVPNYDEDEVGKAEILRFIRRQSTQDRLNFVTTIDHEITGGRISRAIRNGDLLLDDVWALLSATPATVSQALVEVFIEEQAATIAA